jgi:transcription-repair coupling factor (superfamily II helicase)
VDILIGTHRLLSKDVNFKNLGLLIVDEEQKFGVTHKERIKKNEDLCGHLSFIGNSNPSNFKYELNGFT